MSFIKTEIQGSILIMQISRPESLNALNQGVMDELRSNLQAASANDQVSGIIMTGEGEKAFVAGADIKELSALSGAEAKKLAQKGQDLFKSIENSTKPVIAVVNGFA